MHVHAICLLVVISLAAQKFPSWVRIFMPLHSQLLSWTACLCPYMLSPVYASYSSFFPLVGSASTLSTTTFLPLLAIEDVSSPTNTKVTATHC